MTSGRVNPQFRLEDQGIEGLGNVYYNFMEPALIEEALKRGEGTLGNGGAFLVTTGKFTGRSPKDKFIVRDAQTEGTVNWGGINQPIDRAHFDAMHARVRAYYHGRDAYVLDCYAGADPAHRLKVRVVTETAWQNLFARNMFIRPPAEELPGFAPDFTSAMTTSIAFPSCGSRPLMRSSEVISTRMSGLTPWPSRFVPSMPS